MVQTFVYSLFVEPFIIDEFFLKNNHIENLVHTKGRNSCIYTRILCELIIADIKKCFKFQDDWFNVMRIIWNFFFCCHVKEIENFPTISKIFEAQFLNSTGSMFWNILKFLFDILKTICSRIIVYNLTY